MMKQLLIVVLLLVNRLCYSQSAGTTPIQKVEIFAIAPDMIKGSGRPTESYIRSLTDRDYCYHKIRNRNWRINRIAKKIPELDTCFGYEGLIYPIIILDLYYADGHKEKLVVGDLQNYSYNDQVLKQDIRLYRTILRLLPIRFRFYGERIKSIDEFCT